MHDRIFVAMCVFAVASVSCAAMYLWWPSPAVGSPPLPPFMTSEWVSRDYDKEDFDLVRPSPDPSRNGALVFCTQGMLTHYPFRCQTIRRWIGGIEQMDL